MRIGFNIRSQGLGAFHLFPAIIDLNTTSVLWIAEDIVGWRNQSIYSVGYDYVDVSKISNITAGLRIQVKGYWRGVTDSPFSNALVLATCVGDSYLRLSNDTVTQEFEMITSAKAWSAAIGVPG